MEPLQRSTIEGRKDDEEEQKNISKQERGKNDIFLPCPPPHPPTPPPPPPPKKKKKTVPTCNELYKTSYTYFTTPAIPPDLRACCEFILRARSGLPGGGNVVGGLGSDAGGFVPHEAPGTRDGGSGGGGGQRPPPPPGRVLIHDMTGAARAPLVAAAWLVAAHGAGPQAALAACAARRPGVAPAAADVRVLAAFARELRGSPGGGAEFAAAGRRQQRLQTQSQQGQWQGQQQQQQFFQQ